jgi:hypothetical protein
MSDGVRDIWKKSKDVQSPIKVWLDVMKVLVSGELDTYIIVDALDECPSTDGEQKLLLASSINGFLTEFEDTHHAPTRACEEVFGHE